MITEFKTGYYYKWIGLHLNWNKDASPILDGKWRKCIYGKDCYANFHGIKEKIFVINRTKGWNFEEYLNCFEETKTIKLIKTEEILKKWK